MSCAAEFSDDLMIDNPIVIGYEWSATAQFPDPPLPPLDQVRGDVRRFDSDTLFWPLATSRAAQFVTLLLTAAQTAQMTPGPYHVDLIGVGGISGEYPLGVRIAMTAIIGSSPP